MRCWTRFSVPAVATTALALLVLAGCVASPAIEPSSSPGDAPSLSTARPTQPGTPTPTATPTPSVGVSPRGGSVEPSPAAWSKARSVGLPGDCQVVTALIDGTGGRHLAAGCVGMIRYYAQTGANWETVEFAVPEKRQEYDPQLAVQGDVLYLAYTRVAIEEGGCGDPGLRDVGVHVRTKKLTASHWSEPRLIGEVADHLHSFRVVGGTIHATVANERDGLVYYETENGDAYRRYRIPQATGVTALRVGDDGKARVAYEAEGAIWYGVFNGSGFSREKVAGSTNGYRPVLVLTAGDRPYLLWRRGYHGSGGCIDPDSEPEAGTYYATKVGGVWESVRLTPQRGVASITIDVNAGRIHVLVSGRDGLAYLSRTGSGSWSKHTFAEVNTSDGAIRLDPTTGALLVAFIGYDAQTATSYVYVMTHE
jgi:hypothetical protein